MSVNSIVLMGRLTAAPVMRTTTAGDPAASFQVAVDRDYADEQGRRPADFIPVVCFRKTAEFVDRYFSKGDMIAMQGRLQTRTYTDRDGNKRTAYEVLAERVSFCGGKREREEAPASRDREPDGETPGIGIEPDELPFG